MFEENPDAGIVDSFMINGAASKQDTYTLIKKAVWVVLKTADDQDGLTDLNDMLVYRGYFSSGKPKIDWSSEQEKNELIATLVKDARTLNEYLTGLPKISVELKSSLRLLELVAEQDIQEVEGQIEIARGTCKDRTISITDPEI